MHESRIAPLSSVEAGFASWLTVHAQRERAPAPLTLVEISDDDLQSVPWPWTPNEFSLFLNATLPFQPPVLAVEPVMAWKNADAQQLAILHNQVLRPPKMLLGAELGLPEDLSVVPPMQEVPVLRHVKGDLTTLPEFTLVARQPAEEIRLAQTLGFLNLPEAATGNPVRRVPLVFRYRGQVVPSFVLQAAMLWFSVTPDEVLVAPGESIQLGKALTIPIDARGAMAVDFAVPMTRFSRADLLLSAEQAVAKRKTIAPVLQIKHSVTLLARSDTAARSLRFADGRMGSPGELIASAIATILNRDFFQSAPFFVEVLIVADGLILACFCTRIRRRKATVICGVILCAYVLLALGVFAGTSIAMPLTLPVGLTGFVWIFRMRD